MINPETIKLAKEAVPEAQKLVDYLLHSFALTDAENHEGLDPLLLIGYVKVLPALKELKLFLDQLLIIEGQLMTYLSSLGADAATIGQSLIDGGILPPGPIL